MSLGDAYADAHLDTDSLDSDIAQVSAMLDNAVAQWESILSVTGAVDMDTSEATAQIEAAVDAWNAMLDENLAAAVDLDTSEATAHLVTAREEWSRLASDPIEAKVQVVVEDAESLANLATTFTGIKPLLDLPVRFHLDQASVIEVTTEISALAAAWSDALDIKVTPTSRPQGDNDLPNRPGQPARPRGPPGEPVVRPQVDPTDAEIQARLLTQVLEGILKAAATIRIDGDEALADAETLVPLIERVVSTSAEVRLDGEGLIEHAEALRQLVEQTLADAKARPSLDGGALIGQIEALAAAIGEILDVTAEPHLDEEGFRARLIALAAEVEAVVGGITVGIDPEIDPERSVADARLIKRLLEGVLKITVPVDMSDTEAVAQAESLKPLIERILRISTTVDLDGAGAVAEAEAIGTLLDEALDIAMKVDFDSGGATAQAAALKATINGILRDLVINTDLDGAEATAHAVALRAVLERILGRDIEVNVDVDSIGQATQAVSGFARLFSGLFTNIGGSGGGGAGQLALSASGVGGVFTSLGGSIASASGILIKFGAILAAVAAGLPLLLGGLSALAAAAGGVLGLAAAFATLAVSIGGAAAAMPILGVALNKDLVEKAKGGLNELKNNVAAITRGLGEELLTRFQGPFVNVLTQIAASATKLGDALFPVLDAVVGLLGKFNAALQTSDAREFVNKMSASLVEWIDLFGDYLDDYLALVNDVFGSTSGLRDFVQAILDLGLQAGPLFESLGRFLSEMSKGISTLGPIALPLVEKLVDLLTKIGNSNPFQQMVRGGIEMFSLLLDIIDQIGTGLENVGLESVMDSVIGAFDSLVNSGFGEQLGEIFATLMDTGAALIDLFAEFAASQFFSDIVAFLQEALPLVVEFIARFAEGFAVLGENDFSSTLKTLLAMLQSVVLLAEPLGMILNIVIWIGKATFSAGVAFGSVLSSAVTAFVGLVVEGWEKLGWIMSKMDWIPLIGDDIAETGREIHDWAKGASDDIWEFGRSGAKSTGDFMASIWSADVTVSQFGGTLDTTFGNGTHRIDEFSAATERFHDSLGDGAVALENYARANNLTSEEIAAAGEAAASVADQFKYTTDLIGKLREGAAKPIALSIDFSKTKLDLNNLVTYVDAAVKTTQEKVGSALQADPGAQDLAAGVMGADGTNLAGLTDQTITTETFVPAHLETSVMDSIDQLMDNLDRDVANKDYLTALEFNGFSDLADRLREFDGPKLELAIQELGEAGSAQVRAANEKLRAAQAKADTEFNPIQTDIDEAKKAGILKVRQIQVVKELEGAGFSELAAQYATLKPEDLEAALRSYDELGGVNSPVIAGMDQQLKDLQKALEESAVANDPFGKMWEKLGEQSEAAQEAFLAKVSVSPELIAAATGKVDIGQFSPEQRALRQMLDTIATGLASDPTKVSDAEMGQRLGIDLERWRALVNNFDPKTGAAPTNVTTTELQFLKLLKAREAAGSGGQVDPTTGQVMPGTAEAATAGENIATAVANGMGGEEASTKVAEAANTLMTTAVDKLVESLEGNKVLVTQAGENFYFAFSDALSIMLVTEAPILVSGFIDVLTGYFLAKVDNWKGAIRTVGRAYVGYVIDGMVNESGERFPGIVEALYTALVAMLTVGAIANFDSLFGSGVLLGVGFTGGFASQIDDALAAVDLLFTVLVAALGRNTATSLDTYLTTGAAVALFLAAGLVGQETAVTGGVDGLMGQVLAALEVAEERGVQRAHAAGQAIAGAISKGLSTTIGGADDKKGGGVKGAVSKVAEGASAPGVGIGEAIVDGIIMGIQSRVPDLIAAATAVATIVETVIRTRMAIRSPSGVTMLMGEQIAEGLALGIENGHGRVAGAVDGLTTRVSAPISIRPEFPPSATAARPELLEVVQALLGRAVGAPGQAAPNAAEMAAPGGWRGRGPDPATSGGAFIHADVVNINGVPGAAEMPQRTTAGFWRLGYGESVN